VHWGSRSVGGCGSLRFVLPGSLLVGLVALAASDSAQALPSYARQTGQPCGTCHTDFPALTPFGRRFKLLGYTTGGGPYRTTPFARYEPSDDADALANLARYVKELAAGEPGAKEDAIWVPPISAMAILGFTHTQVPLQPPTDPYQPNNNTILSPASFFYGGAITQHVGAFAQVTYNAPPVGGLAPFGHTWTWDNTDIRIADVRQIWGMEFIYGITANNNPTVQDVWNTTPAWTFPYASSTIAPTPATHTLIDGTFAAHVASVGAYTYINNMLYLEASSYWTIDFNTQNVLGANPFAAPGLFNGAAPYWRVAFEPHWNNHWLMLGTFGMYAQVHPWVDATFATGTTDTLPQTNTFTDVGFDTQYQYQADRFWLTLRGSYIHEWQKLDASFISGAATNTGNDLNTLRLQASLALGGDNKVVATGQYFDTWGSFDPTYWGLATGRPNSNGWIAEIAYIPFGVSAAPGWPWANARIGLQYIWYDKFNGTSVGAHDNDTLFLHTWVAF